MNQGEAMVYFTCPAFMDGAMIFAGELMGEGFLVFNSLSVSHMESSDFMPPDGFDWKCYRKRMMRRCDAVVSYATSLGYDDGWELEEAAVLGLPVIHARPEEYDADADVIGGRIREAVAVRVIAARWGVPVEDAATTDEAGR